MSQLTIYKASAGSGKTFRLTKEFLHLIFKYPNNYRRILAVTFTNKATSEMKSRILSELNTLSKGLESKYKEDLKNHYQLTDSEVQAKAQKILTLLLHDFSKFSVSTIDKFFQKIIRSFTREVGIQPGYSIELNQDEILTKVIDELLIDLDSNPELKDWLSELANDKIEQGSKWDFKDDIQKLAKEIFKEEFKTFDKQLIQKMSDKSFLNSYIKRLQEIKASFENTMESIAVKALDQIRENELSTDDFKWGKSSVPNYFNKVLNKDYELKTRTINGTEDYKEWFTEKSDKKEIIEQTLDNGLFYSLNEIVDYYQTNKTHYYSSIEILKYIHTLGILTDISRKLREYCEEQNMFLISDAAKLIQIIIDNNDSPFIYEKTGNIYRHFMIDEFQDTSKIQWHNFRPLISNSLAHGSKNLVVGDVKQSIYRWRNSDWEILSEEIENDFKQYEPDAQTLNINWRSRKNIIDYNNAVFNYSAHILQNDFNGEHEELNQKENPFKSKIIDAYHDVFQNIPSGNGKVGGYVNHTFLNENDFDSWKDEVKKRVPAIIENLQDKGYDLKDIAILVRSGREGQEIANTLIEYKNQNASNYKFDFISNDSLYLANSSLVKFILALLEFILNPDDEINLSFIAYENHIYLKSNNSEEIDLHAILKTSSSEEKEERLQEIFPNEFIESLDQIKQLPIYELIDRLIRIFKLNDQTKELPYLKAFLDIVLDFSKKSTSDIHSFVNWWNEDGIKKTLSISENQDAIRIITIHSSKGLEFKNVIIPFCNWEIDHKPSQTNILWCKTEEEPFKQLDLIPVKYSKKLSETIFQNDYLKEKFHAYVDNLNLLYVAFTRAEQNLFNFSPKKEKSNGIKNVGELLYFAYDNYKNYSVNEPLICFEENWKKEDNIFELGELKEANHIKEKLPDEFKLSKFESFDIKNKLRLKLHDNSFFTGRENAPFEKVNHGKILHEVFENIKIEADAPSAIDKMIFEGKISPEEKPDLLAKLHKIFENDQISNWFCDEWTVKTEAEIILTNGKTARPDRVISNDKKTIVIDYKFGEIEEEKHQQQVKGYMDLLKQMENKEVEGYLWYVDLGKVVKL